MHINRQELLSSATRRMRRARRTTGRILVSALGFGVAYYFDTENGEVRRQRLMSRCDVPTRPRLRVDARSRGPAAHLLGGALRPHPHHRYGHLPPLVRGLSGRCGGVPPGSS